MIDFEHVSKEYKKGGRLALEDINLHVDDGEFVFLLGHSGAGKSTLLKLILREELPTSGKVTVLGKDVAHLRRRKVPYLRRQMGIIFQDFRLIPSMTVYENIAFAMHVTNVKRSVIRERVEYMLELVHLEDKAKVYPDTLSGGEQQRVAVARALAHSPKLVIADEPTGNIDPELSLEMMELLERVSQTGITVLVVTHEHELVHRFHQRVVTLKNGRIISDIPADPEAIAARSAELNAWKDLTEPVDDEPDEQTDENEGKGGGDGMRISYLFLSDPARPAQSGQALGHDHCLHRLPERLYDPEHLCHAGGSQCEQHGELSGPAERDGGLCGPRSRRCHHPVGRGAHHCPPRA